MGRNLVETLIGAAVLVVAVVFIAYASNRSNVATVEGYEGFARFSSVEGLKVGDDVRISGIKVGSIIDQSLDPGFFQAVVRMSIEPSVELPEDITVAVTSEGLLGGKFIYGAGGGKAE